MELTVNLQCAGSVVNMHDGSEWNGPQTESTVRLSRESSLVDFFVEAEGIDEQPVMVAKAMGRFVLPVLGICGSKVEVVDYQLPGGGSKIKAARKR